MPQWPRNRRAAALAKAVGPQDDATQRRIGGALDKALAALAASANAAAVLRALQMGRTDAALAGLGWDELSHELTDALMEPTAGVFLAKMANSLRELRPPTAALEFDLIEARALAFAQAQAGRLVVSVSAELRSNARSIIVEAMGGGMTAKQAAAHIRDGLPLTPRWQLAVERTRSREFGAAVKDGKSADAAQVIADAAASRQAERLRTVRADTIARTEIMTASNAGRFEGWAADIADGWSETDSKKEWIGGDNPCPECDPTIGEIVLWDQPFSNGALMPPLHPACRCTAVLLPGKTREREGQGRPADSSPGPRSSTSTSRPTPRPASNPDRKLNAGDLTNEQGALLTASSWQVIRGEKTQAEHKAYVMELTNTDARGYPRK